MQPQIAIVAVLIVSPVIICGEQDALSRQEPAALAPTAHQPEEEGDRFQGARIAGDEARKIHEKIYSENIGEVQRLLKSRRCQITRIAGLLDRTNESLETWLAAEKFYWTSWNDAETKRVEGQQKSLASLESDRQRAADLVEADKQDREELARRKANLEKSARTAQITAEIDGLIRDIQDSEARLSEAQRQFDAITSTLNNLKASITARLINIRQNLAQLDTYRLEQHALYEDRRKAAQEICNTKQPDTRKSPLPRRGSGGQ